LSAPEVDNWNAPSVSRAETNESDGAVVFQPERSVKVTEGEELVADELEGAARITPNDGEFGSDIFYAEEFSDGHFQVNTDTNSLADY